ncbi:MAG: hypothetical protein KDJ75_10105 [Alphaproteobacteria bacterium]|nr:hypothetical protein [Alphaproteobacteria bacterium]
MNNEERAEHAGNAMSEYLSSKGEPHDREAQDYEIADLICDLMHLADRHGFDIESIKNMAEMHYQGERNEP